MNKIIYRRNDYIHKYQNMSITFSTCWYNFKAKFTSSVYENWMHNMLSTVNNYNLVVYTDWDGYNTIQKYLHSKIKVVIKPYESFHTFPYEQTWIQNQSKNILLKDRVDWRVNMLWSEKIAFVKETIEKKFFDTEYYGWCDIGYFRGRRNDLSTDLLVNWPSPDKVSVLNKDKIHYAMVNNNNQQIDHLFRLINRKNNDGLPMEEIPMNQISVAGGFFILHKDRIDWWHNTYYTKLKLYFEHNRLVKDDQIIIIDCILSDINKFCLWRESDPHYDNWFLFQRSLL